MSTPTSTLRPPQSPTEAPYRTLSGLAVASMALAAVFAVLIGILAVSAFLAHDMLIAPVWLIGLAVAAAFLSIIAGIQIRGSEGTLTGLGFARVGFWLALFPALAYFAYYIGTYQAIVRVQAERVTREWFDDLRQGKVRDAFLLCCRPSDRRNLSKDPQEFNARYVWGGFGQPGPFTRFEQHEVIRAMVDGGQDVKVESLGIKSWEYYQKRYNIEQSFRIDTPEGVFDVSMYLSGAWENNRRQWQIVWTQTQNMVINAARPTAMGDTVRQWRHQATALGNQWLAWHRNGDLIECYLWTLPQDERRQLTVAYYGRVTALSLAATTGLAGLPAGALWMANRPALNALFWPGKAYDDFVAGKSIIHWDQSLQADESIRGIVGPAVQAAFQDKNRAGMMTGKQALARPHRLADGKGTQMFLDVMFGMREKAADGTLKPKYQCTAVVTLETAAVPTDMAIRPEWRVTNIQLVSAQAGEQMSPMGHNTIAVPMGPDGQPDFSKMHR